MTNAIRLLSLFMFLSLITFSAQATENMTDEEQSAPVTMEEEVSTDTEEETFPDPVYDTSDEAESEEY